jgi:hypothetical protein
MAELVNALMACAAMAAIPWIGYDLHRGRHGPF